MKLMPPPLREIVETKPGLPVSLGDLGISLRTVIHKLECGHTTEPYVRDGCRVPRLPKRRRCKECKPKMIIRGLSLTRPWPFAFLNAGRTSPPKRVENRGWKPPDYLVSHYLALHAAQSWSEYDREFIASATGLSVPGKIESPHGNIFAVCRVTGYVENAHDERMPREQRVWFIGPYAWLLDEFVHLAEPVPCKGGLGLWRLEVRPGVLVAVRRAYRRAQAVTDEKGDG